MNDKNSQLSLKFELIPRIKTLQHIGIGMQYFPSYVNLNSLMLHSLDIVLLSFIIKGKVVHHLDFETYEESDLSLSIINYEQKHCITTEPSGAEIMNIYLDLKRLTLPVLPDKLQRFVHLFLPIYIGHQNKFYRMIRLSFSPDDNIVPLIREMEMELNSGAVCYEEVIMDYFKIFLVKCARKAMEKHPQSALYLHTDTLSILEKLRQYLDRNYHKEFTLESLAEIANFSPNYLCRIFKKYTEKSLSEYINEKRLQAAMILLTTTHKQVIQIANEVGFNDLSYFNRLFKNKTGISPSQFRKKQYLN